MKQVTIRPISTDEVAAVTTVWRLSRIDAMQELEARLGHSYEDDLEHFSHVVIPKYDVLVAELEGAVVGMMAVCGEDLDKLYVHPRYQRLGVGTRLLDYAKAKSVSGLSLFTHQINARARAFYEKNGFTATKFGISPPPESEPDVQYIWAPRRPENAA